MKKIRFILLISIILLSCKKDKLEGDKSVLVGNWNWVESEREFNACTGDLPKYEVITPETEGSSFSLSFENKGVVQYFENGVSLTKDRLVFFRSEEDCTYRENSTSFSIYLNNKTHQSKYLLQGCVGSDTLVVIRGFPFEFANDDPCESYTSIFVKQ